MLHAETGDVSLVGGVDPLHGPAGGTVPIGSVGERANAIAVLDPTVYVAAAEGNIYAIDQGSGDAAIVARVRGKPTALDVSAAGLWVAVADGTVTKVPLERATPPEPAQNGVVLTSGTAAGQPWELRAERGAEGMLLLTLRGPDRSAALDGAALQNEEDIQATTVVFRSGEEAELVAFGAVSLRVTRVEVFPAYGGPAVSADVLDVPDRIDPRRNAFAVVAVADLPATLNAYDAEGNVVARVPLRIADSLGRPDSPDEEGFALWPADTPEEARGADGPRYNEAEHLVIAFSKDILGWGDSRVTLPSQATAGPRPTPSSGATGPWRWSSWITASTVSGRWSACPL